MTRARRSGFSDPWPTAAWMMVGLTAFALGVGAVGGVLSPTIILDIVSMWPLTVLALVAAIVSVPFRRRNPRLRAVPALLIVSWLLAATGLHLAGWAALPSAAADVEAPAGANVDQVRLEVWLSGGQLEVRGTDGVDAWRVEPMREGGDVPAPMVAVAEDGSRVEVREGDPSSWYRHAGWRILVTPEASLDVLVVGEDVEVVIDGIAPSVLTLEGSGRVTFDEAFRPGRLSELGEFEVTANSGG